MSNIIIGTAGHIDHGKTALIRALNGFEGDSTNEEKQRGITIDLSFSNLTRAERNIAFIDVPGHEKLIKNMIAGAFGFDYVMLVVSAKEGLMPQTIEHIEILSLLGIKNLILVITKILPLQTGAKKDGSGDWKKQLFILDSKADYNNIYCFEIFGDDKVENFNI